MKKLGTNLRKPQKNQTWKNLTKRMRF